tara:strand:+ start:2785 stop:3057 length:273 start_codon:yes stop_codon:yes gene_type:complete
MSSLPKYILEEMKKLEKTDYTGIEKKNKIILDLANDDSKPLLSELELDILLDDLVEFIIDIAKGEIKVDLKKVKKYSKFLTRIRCCLKKK